MLDHEELKLTCLELACRVVLNGDGDGALRIAKEYFAWASACTSVETAEQYGPDRDDQ